MAADGDEVRARLVVLKDLAALPAPTGQMVRTLYSSAGRHVEARAYDQAIVDYQKADEAVPAFERVPGLLFKSWFSDEVSERWGAVYLWESQEASEQELPSRARELIGKNPDIVEVFDLEASVSVAEELRGLGLAFE